MPCYPGNHSFINGIKGEIIKYLYEKEDHKMKDELKELPGEDELLILLIRNLDNIEKLSLSAIVRKVIELGYTRTPDKVSIQKLKDLIIKADIDFVKDQETEDSLDDYAYFIARTIHGEIYGK